MSSGFDAQFYQILNNKGETEVYDYPGAIVLNIDFEAMGIELPEPSTDTIRYFYVGHNYEEANVEYLPLSVSSDKSKGAVSVSSLSPFAIVYRDVKKTEPPVPSYIPPKTGVE